MISARDITALLQNLQGLSSSLCGCTLTLSRPPGEQTTLTMKRNYFLSKRRPSVSFSGGTLLDENATSGRATWFCPLPKAGVARYGKTILVGARRSHDIALLSKTRQRTKNQEAKFCKTNRRNRKGIDIATKTLSRQSLPS